MANYTLSYDYQNQVRDLSDAFATVVANNPVTNRILTVSNEPYRNTKLEWLNDYANMKTRKLSAAHTAGSGVIQLASVAGLEVGTLLKFEKPTGKSSTLVAKVVNINPNTGACGIVVYGGSTDEDLAVNSTAIFLSKPAQEGSDAGQGDGYEPSVDYNFSQIFDRVAQVSLTAYNQEMYGINRTPGEVLNYQVERKLIEIGYEVATTTISSPRVQRTDTENGTMGGWLWFLKKETGNSTNANDADLSASLLNEAFERMYSRGIVNNPTIVAHPVQAKRLSALNRDKLVVARDDTTGGTYVERFVSDFGNVASIVYSPQMDKDTVAIIDPTLIVLRPFLNDAMRDMDATLPGSRTIRRRITGQYSLEVRNAKVMQYIYNLKV